MVKKQLLPVKKPRKAMAKETDKFSTFHGPGDWGSTDQAYGRGVQRYAVERARRQAASKSKTMGSMLGIGAAIQKTVRKSQKTQATGATRAVQALRDRGKVVRRRAKARGDT